MLPRHRRLGRGTSLRAVQTSGRRFGDPTLAVVVLRLPEGSDGSRFAFVTSRKVGKAHVRNLVRRRLRSLVAAVLPELGPVALVLVVARPEAARASHEALGSSLRGLLIRAGLLPSTEGTSAQ